MRMRSISSGKRLALVGLVLLLGAAVGASSAQQSLITVLSYQDLVRFQIQKAGVEAAQVQIYDLSGNTIYQTGWSQGPTLDWPLITQQGQRVANGVFLYVIKTKNAQGQEQQWVGKLAVLDGVLQVGLPPELQPARPTGPQQPEFQQPGEVRAQQFDVTGNWTVGGLLGVGTDTPSHPLHVLKTVSGTGALFGGRIEIDFDPPSATSSSQAALSISSRVATTNTQNFIGLFGGFLNVEHFGSGTITNAFGFQGKVNNQSTGTIDRARGLFSAVQNLGSGTINTGYGVYIQRPRNLGGGTFNTFYGLFIENPTEAASNWSIYSQGGQNYFGGNVGIGITQPSAALDIRASTANLIRAQNSATGQTVFKVQNDGDVYADGSFNCGLSSGCFNSGQGADVAERIDATEPLEPGDVVEIDPENPGKFRKAREAMSRRVAGVISTAPAITLGNDFDPEADRWEDTRPLLALAGRVPVKAVAKFGAIEVGDLLVASPIPGYAMKCPEASQCVGAVIGKALEPLKEGVGMIEVQVMLR